MALAEESVRNGAREGVGAEVQRLEVREAGEVGREVAGEVVAGEGERLERLEAEEAPAELAGEAEAVEGEPGDAAGARVARRPSGSTTSALNTISPSTSSFSAATEPAPRPAPLASAKKTRWTRTSKRGCIAASWIPDGPRWDFCHGGIPKCSRKRRENAIL